MAQLVRSLYAEVIGFNSKELSLCMRNTGIMYILKRCNLLWINISAKCARVNLRGENLLVRTFLTISRPKAFFQGAIFSSVRQLRRDIRE